MATDMPVHDGAIEDSWVEVSLPTGRTVKLRGLAEVDSPDEDRGRVQDVRFRSFDFRTLTATLREVGDLVKDAVQALTPAEAQVELGLGFSAKTGQVLVLFGEASGNASMKVTLKWRFERQDGHDDEA